MVKSEYSWENLQNIGFDIFAEMSDLFISIGKFALRKTEHYRSEMEKFLGLSA